MSYRMFLTPGMELYTGDVTDQFSADLVAFGSDPEPYYDVSSYTVSSYVIDALETKAIPILPNEVLGDSRLLIIKVVGEITISTVAKDFDGTTTINGSVGCYGVAKFPGIMILNTYNINSMTVTGVTNSTKVEVFSSRYT